MRTKLQEQISEITKRPIKDKINLAILEKMKRISKDGVLNKKTLKKELVKQSALVKLKSKILVLEQIPKETKNELKENFV